MSRSLVALAAVLLSCAIGGANEKPPVVQDVIHATPEKIKKAALSMFADGFTIDSNTASQLEVSRPVSREEITRYNRRNWTNPPLSKCRRMLTFNLLPEDQATSVMIRLGTVCHADGYDGFFKMWGLLSRDNKEEKDVELMQTTLADLKVKVEGTDHRH
jgi:hypothetical protein